MSTPPSLRQTGHGSHTNPAYSSVTATGASAQLDSKATQVEPASEDVYPMSDNINGGPQKRSFICPNLSKVKNLRHVHFVMLAFTMLFYSNLNSPSCSNIIVV